MHPNTLLRASAARRALQQLSLHALGIVVMGAVAVSPMAAQDSSAAKSPPAGAYTEEQAERGNAVFSKSCVECHTRKDMSSADFRVSWNGRTAFDLFDRIRTTMPDALPGSLTPAEYVDVTAYFLKLNGMPAGSMPLPPDSTIRSIRIEIPAPPSGLFSARARSYHSPFVRRGS